jgi:hypothetical protein
LAAARADAEGIRRARAGLDRQMAGLDDAAAELRRQGAETPPELLAKRDELRQERARLDRGLQTLAGAVDDVAGGGGGAG